MKLLIGLSIFATGILVSQNSYASLATRAAVTASNNMVVTLPCGKKVLKPNCHVFSTGPQCGNLTEQASNNAPKYSGRAY